MRKTTRTITRNKTSVTAAGEEKERTTNKGKHSNATFKKHSVLILLPAYIIVLSSLWDNPRLELAAAATIIVATTVKTTTTESTTEVLVAAVSLIDAIFDKATSTA